MLSNLDVMLTNVNPDLKAILLDENSPDFNGLRQSFNEIQRAIYAKDIDVIQKDGLTYNLVQAIQRGDCDVYQAADVMMFYMFMLKLKKYADEHEIEDDWRAIFNFVDDGYGGKCIIGSHHEAYSQGLGKSFVPLMLAFKNAFQSGTGTPNFYSKHKNILDEPISFVIWSLKCLNQDQAETLAGSVNGFPVLRGFDTKKMAHGLIEERRRYLTYPCYLPQQLRKQFEAHKGVRNLASVHQDTYQGYLLVALHDYAHINIEKGILHKEYQLRVELYQMLDAMSSQVDLLENDKSELKQLAADIIDSGVLVTLLTPKSNGELKIFDTKGNIALLSPNIQITIFKKLFNHPYYCNLMEEWHEQWDPIFRQDYIKAMQQALSEVLPAELIENLLNSMTRAEYTIPKQQEILEAVYAYVVEGNYNADVELQTLAGLDKASAQSCHCFGSIFSFSLKRVQADLIKIINAAEAPRPMALIGSVGLGNGSGSIN